jgi:hypothetical protein
MSEPLDFWNYPDWFNDSRDNPRNSAYEPVWMRPIKLPNIPQSGSYDRYLNIVDAVIYPRQGSPFATKVFKK